MTATPPAPPPLPVDDGEDEEVTAVTDAINGLKAETTVCKSEAERAIRAIRATPPKPMPAVETDDDADEK